MRRDATVGDGEAPFESEGGRGLQELEAYPMPMSLDRQGSASDQDNSLSRQSTSIDKDLTTVVSTYNLRHGVEAAVADCTFVVTIADPRLPDCPLIAVSEEFINLTGFQRPEILGFNCRFLNQGCDLDPADLIGLRMASKTGAPFTAVVPNRKKSGELFLNLLDVRGLTVAKDRRTEEDVWFLIGIQADVTDLAEDEAPQDHMDDLQRMADGIRAAVTKEIKDMAIAGTQENPMLPAADQSTWELLEEPVWRTEAYIDAESAAVLLPTRFEAADPQGPSERPHRSHSGNGLEQVPEAMFGPAQVVVPPGTLGGGDRPQLKELVKPPTTSATEAAGSRGLHVGLALAGAATLLALLAASRRRAGSSRQSS